ncbi:MAG: HAMP domain-containing sensor histidine kinase [Nocardioidaceae bacterium]
MRRSLILTVAAAVSMVLLAMLVPLGVLLRSYALEDRLSRAALEVQATETVVSSRDRGAVAAYLADLNRNEHVTTTVLYPPSDLHPEGEAIGPTPGESAAVVEARRTGQASVRDKDGGGAEILVPVSLGRSSAAPSDTPVVRVEVRPPGFEAAIVRSWLVLLLLGVALLAGALVLADRLGRSFVQPIRRLAAYAADLGGPTRPEPISPAGPPEVRELTTATNRLVERIEDLIARERAGVADLSHRLRTPMTALRLRVDALADADDRERLGSDLDELQAMVDYLIRQAQRAETDGLVVSVDAVETLAERARFWAPLAEDQGRRFEIRVEVTEPVQIRASAAELQALVDVLLDNAFTYTPDDADVAVTLQERAEGGVRLVVDDAGPGVPAGIDIAGRGASGTGSTGLGLSIVDKAATEHGGGLSWGRSPLGGARFVVELGPIS